MTAIEFVEIGKLGKTRGVHGEIYVTPMTDFPERFLDMKEIFVNNRGQWETYRLDSSKMISGRPVLKFSGINTPEEAARLTNRHLAVTADKVVQLPEGSFYRFELIDSELIDDESGDSLGTVVDVRSFPANDVYVVRTRSGQEVYFPAIKQFVRRVDTAAHKIYVQSGGFFDAPPDSTEK